MSCATDPERNTPKSELLKSSERDFFFKDEIDRMATEWRS